MSRYLAANYARSYRKRKRQESLNRSAGEPEHLERHVQEPLDRGSVEHSIGCEASKFEFDYLFQFVKKAPKLGNNKLIVAIERLLKLSR